MATLRRATPDDAEALTRLRGVMHTSMGDALTDVWYDECVAAFRRRTATEGFRAYVVEVDGAVVSGGSGWCEEHLPSPYLLSGMRGHIASMSTDPAWLRRGYARLVFTGLLDWFAAKDVPRIDLRATDDGRPLYESFGFRVLGGATMAWTAPGVVQGMPER